LIANNTFLIDGSLGTATIESAGSNKVIRGNLGYNTVLATGAGHTVDDVITILQNLGLVRQS
jgi:hypothetical protein